MATIGTNSPLGPELNEIVQRPNGFKPYFLTTAILHTDVADLNENEGVIVGPYRVERDYVNDGADYIELTLLVKLSTFVYDVYPNSGNLELTLTRLKQSRSRSGNGYETSKSEERYKAFYLVDKNAGLPINVTGERDMLDRQGYVTVSLQLVDLSSMSLRTSNVQGHYSNIISENKDMTYSSLLKSILSNCTKATTILTKPIVNKIEIEEADNKDPINAITIPTGTTPMLLAEYFQEKCGGLYTGGVGTYLQKYSQDIDSPIEKVLFVYSLFSRGKWDDAKNKIMFYVSPEKAWNTVDHTYTIRSNILKALTHPINGLISDKGTAQRSQGEGFRTAMADAVMDVPVLFTDEGPKFQKTTFLTEVSDKDQTDGINFAPYKGISNNHFKNASDINARSGEYVAIQVDNLDPDYIYPGAPCSITLDVGGMAVREVFGVIHKAVFAFEYGSFDFNAEINKQYHPLINSTFITVYLTDV